VDKPTYELPEGYIPTDIEVGGSYGVIDLGTLNWIDYSSSNYHRYATSGLLNLVKSGGPDVNAVCSAYIMDFIGVFSTPSPNKKGFGFAYNKYLYILDSDYTSPEKFKAAMSGIYLIFERVTPSSPTLVKGNELNKYCIHNGQIGVYSDTFKYNSNIPLKKWLRRLKIGGA